ncbi:MULTISPECIES: LuxR C-terminal-related transcriptional regulator [unclassified Pseudomonas]|uniref:LuxR C-terminal-related transcriptional regulator n=1 Tax=unclassified Pseudomonas TaxID=196821 RepID=UPI002449ABEB|nr:MULTISPECIES: LuxR C-terminal-related transcriptional regulator [unclassified Pseudomonas]MDG9924436.1 LuxR C-terminal-related transcriptional regulator [Pseudomonas sp. GD04045]MDH0035224.1 LuxR C-terminal-related transcriptional regulator [Pseudomonas sp. GD04019]
MEPELVLKTTPPRSQKAAFRRERLSLDMDELATRTALSVHAPAGFGKTWLLSQWRRELLSRGAVVAWLTLDGRDDSVRFVQGLAAAMLVASGRPAFASSANQAMSRRDALGDLTEWLAEVADLGGEVALILDEVDALPDATIREALTYLLHNAPANLRVLMASRRRLNLQAAELQARGVFLGLGLDALRFRVDETVAVLASRFGEGLDIDLKVLLHELTEGWPLGLQLAVAAIERSAGAERAIHELKACSGDIQRYFVDSLVAKLQPEQVDFLTCIALPETLHPELCVALTGNPQAAQMMAELCASTPIFSEGLGSDWVRIHPLAREFLQQRVALLPAARRCQLHQRAATWLEARGFFEEAAHHYLSAELPAQAYNMIEQCLYEIMLRGQFNRVIEWIGELPAEEVESRPRMCLAAAWALAMSERSAQARHLIVKLQSDPSVDEEASCEAAAIASAAAYFADRPDESQAIIGRWTESPPKGSIKVQAIVANQQARLALFRGQPEAARRICRKAPQYSWTEGLDAIRGFAEWVIGVTYLWEGRMLPAAESLRSTLQHAEQDIGRRSSVATLLASSLAAVLLERDELGEATTVLANRLDVVERLASPDAIVFGFVTAARLAGLQGQAHRSHDLLEALHALGDERGVPRFCMVSLGEQIRLHALQGRADTCQVLWRRFEEVIPPCFQDPESLLAPELRLHAGVARAYVLLAQRGWPELLATAVELHELASRMRRGRELVQALLFKALALHESGRDGQASLQEAHSLAQEYGMRRVLVDTLPPQARWGAALEAAEPLAAAPKAPVAEPAARVTAAKVVSSRLLTPKEQEVLQLLARNLSNKQIALALNVGEETVKWHLKNLFGKFQAGTRRHVVDRAFMLGILEAER